MKEEEGEEKMNTKQRHGEEAVFIRRKIVTRLIYVLIYLLQVLLVNQRLGFTFHVRMKKKFACKKRRNHVQNRIQCLYQKKTF